MKKIFLSICFVVLFITTNYSFGLKPTNQETNDLFSECDGYARAEGKLSCLSYEEEYDAFAECMESNGFRD